MSVFPGSRVIVHGEYVAFYLVSTETVEIVRVLHGRRDLANL